MLSQERQILYFRRGLYPSFISIDIFSRHCTYNHERRIAIVFGPIFIVNLTEIDKAGQNRTNESGRTCLEFT